MKDKIKENVGHNLYKQMTCLINIQVRNHVLDQVVDKVEDQIFDQVVDKVEDQMFKSILSTLQKVRS